VALAVVLAGRRAAERLMTDRCVIRRPVGEETDPVTFEVRPVYETVYGPDIEPYRGRCKLQTYEAHEATPVVVGATQVVQRSRIDLPVGAYRTAPGDVSVMVEADDPLLVGKAFRLVQEYPVKSHATAYRVFVDDAIGSEVPGVVPGG